MQTQEKINYTKINISKFDGQRNHLGLLVLILLTIVVVGGCIIAYKNKTNNKISKAQDANVTISPTNSITVTISVSSTIMPTVQPTLAYPTIASSSKDYSADIITELQKNALIKSPLIIKGKIKTHWMFEGIFPMLLIDDKRQMIAHAAGKEVVPGSWMGDEMVDFEGKLEFKTDAKNGFLVFQNDNPSGLPEHQKSYEIPVQFIQ